MVATDQRIDVQRLGERVASVDDVKRTILKENKNKNKIQI